MGVCDTLQVAPCSTNASANHRVGETIWTRRTVWLPTKSTTWGLADMSVAVSNSRQSSSAAPDANRERARGASSVLVNDRDATTWERIPQGGRRAPSDAPQLHRPRASDSTG